MNTRQKSIGIQLYNILMTIFFTHLSKYSFTLTPILTATQENEGVGTVCDVKIRQKSRTRKALNIAV